ncbi:MAG: iron-containing alcohol dehydrogenase [Clostridiales bacterium]|nr:iron-containing alcohol dehydrogenase [Clostridiales bacterium]
MKPFSTYLPTKIVFGPGSVSGIADAAAPFGKKAMIVTTGKDLEKLGLTGRITGPLEAAGIEALVYDEISPNPKTHEIDRGVGVFIENKCTAAIGLGGGSAMDAAKAIALVAKNGGTICDFIAGGERRYEAIKESFPCICISTTSGTGSEATQYAVINNPETHEKSSPDYPCLFPAVSIVDPELTLDLPKGITAQTGVDAFYHAMEAYLSTVATPYSDIIAIDCMQRVAKNLETVMENPHDLEARSQMAWANTLGGIAIALTATVGIHAIGNSISGLTDIAHGRALASVGVAFLDYTWDADIRRYSNVARILGAKEGLADEEAAAQCGSLMRGFLGKAGVGATLTDIGVTEGQIEHITDVTFTGMLYGIQVSLKELDKRDVMQIMRNALA